jgi:hypothetical protein
MVEPCPTLSRTPVFPSHFIPLATHITHMTYAYRGRALDILGGGAKPDGGPRDPFAPLILPADGAGRAMLPAAQALPLGCPPCQLALGWTGLVFLARLRRKHDRQQLAMAIRTRPPTTEATGMTTFLLSLSQLLITFPRLDPSH